MPKMLQMFKRRTRRKGGLRRALGLPEKTAAEIIQFPEVRIETQEEHPDYEIISRWLRLADEMLGSDQTHADGNDRRPA